MKELDLENTSFYGLPEITAKNVGQGAPRPNGPFDKPPTKFMKNAPNSSAGGTGMTALGQDVSAVKVTTQVPKPWDADDSYWSGRYEKPNDVAQFDDDTLNLT